MRLIDADKLWKDTTTKIEDCGEFLEIIERQPTIKPPVGFSLIDDEWKYVGVSANAEPVKHGRWIEVNWALVKAICSNCGFNARWSNEYEPLGMNYCPNCGAKMDAERSDNRCK